MQACASCWYVATTIAMQVIHPHSLALTFRMNLGYCRHSRCSTNLKHTRTTRFCQAMYTRYTSCVAALASG